jgi:hypothetical protein
MPPPPGVGGALRNLPWGRRGVDRARSSMTETHEYTSRTVAFVRGYVVYRLTGEVLSSVVADVQRERAEWNGAALRVTGPGQ